MFPLLLALAILLAAPRPARAEPQKGQTQGSAMNEKQPLPVATLAGGCFWCTESDFRKAPGVVQVVSGYAGGRGDHPNYEKALEALKAVI